MQETINRMRALYESMDAAYDSLAGHYGFGCRDCEDNCCRQRFFHYTLAEYYYLLEGIKSAEPEVAGKVLSKALVVNDAYRRELEAGEILPLMCPANFEGLCRLYAHRPMICRVHGLPHSFRMPDGRETEGGGCARFEAAHDIDERMDRTALYTVLAEIERDFRLRTGRKERIKMTTARMLVEMLGEDEYLSGLLDGE